MGAAVQGGVLSGDVSDVLLLDVTPLNLGIETLGGVMTSLITANTTIPTKKSEIFSTASDSQTSVEIHVLQGDRQMAIGNRTIGRFHLDGIPPAPRGIPQIEVAFDIDANGILEVAAKDNATGKKQNIRIEASSGLSDQEIEKMRQDAKTHAEEDEKKRAQIEKRNQADSLAYSTEKNLKEYGDKIPAEKKAKVEAALERLKESAQKTTSPPIWIPRWSSSTRPGAKPPRTCTRRSRPPHRRKRTQTPEQARKKARRTIPWMPILR